LWAGTNQYQSGKYVRDGVYDPNAVDSQPGCAGLLMAMMALDPSIRFGAEKSASTDRPAIPAHHDGSGPQEPSIHNPSRGSIGAFIKSVLTAIFGGK